jgi:hypothetical protein
MQSRDGLEPPLLHGDVDICNKCMYTNNTSLMSSWNSITCVDRAMLVCFAGKCLAMLVAWCHLLYVLKITLLGSGLLLRTL